MLVSEGDEDLSQDSYDETSLDGSLPRFLNEKTVEYENTDEILRETQNVLTNQKGKRTNSEKVIEALRRDLSDCQRDIKALQKENKKLRKENGFLEKELDDLRKDANSLQLAKKSEQRTKEKFLHLKQTLVELKMDSENKEKECFDQIEQFQSEIKELMRRIGEQEKQNKELTQRNRTKDEEIGKLLTRITELEQSEKKVQELLKISEMKQRECARVIQLLKKDSENQIRLNLNSRFSNVSINKTIEEKENFDDSTINLVKELSSSPRSSVENDTKITKPVPQKNFSAQKSASKSNQSTNKTQTSSINQCKPTPKRNYLDDSSVSVQIPTDYSEIAEKKSNTASLANELLKAELLDAIAREQNMIEAMDNLILRETDSVNNVKNELVKNEVTLKSEQECWVMQFEELKQKLYDREQKIQDLQSIIDDCRFKLSEHLAQRKQERESNESQIQHFNDAILQLKSELDARDQLLEKVLPFGNSISLKVSTMSNEYASQLKKSNAELEAENKLVHEEKKSLLFHFEDLKVKHNELFESFIKLRGVYLQIEDQLGLFSDTDPQPLTEDSPKSQDSPLPAVPMSEGILKKIQELLASANFYENQSRQLAEEKEILITKLTDAKEELSERYIEADEQKIEKHIDSLDSSVKEMSRALELANKEIKKLTAESIVKSNQLDMQKKLLDDKNYELVKFNKELENACNLSSKQTAVIQENELNLKETSAELVELKAKASQNEWALNLKLQEMVVELVDLKQKIELLENQNADLSSHNAKCSQEKSVLLNSIKNYQAKLELEENEISAMDSKVRRLEQENAHLQDFCGLTKSNLENSQTEIDRAKQALYRLEEANQDLKSQLSGAQEGAKTAEEDLKRIKASHKNEILQLKQECESKAAEIESLTLKLRKIALEMNQAKESQNSMIREVEKLRAQLIQQKEIFTRDLGDIIKEIGSMAVHSNLEDCDCMDRFNLRFQMGDKHNNDITKLADPCAEDIKFRLRSFNERNSKCYQTLEHKLRQYDFLLGIVSKLLNEYNQQIISDKSLKEMDEIQNQIQSKQVLMHFQDFKLVLSGIIQKARNKGKSELEGAKRILESLLDKLCLNSQQRTNYQRLVKECEGNLRFELNEANPEFIFRVQEAIKELIDNQRTWIDNENEIKSKKEAMVHQKLQDLRATAVSETSKILNLLSCNVLHRVNTTKDLKENVAEARKKIQRDATRDSEKSIDNILFNIIEDLLDQIYNGSNELADVLCLTSERIKEALNDSFKEEHEMSFINKIELRFTNYWRKEDKLIDRIISSLSRIEKESIFNSQKYDHHLESAFQKDVSNLGLNLFYELFKDIRNALEISKEYISSLNQKSLARSSLVGIVTDTKTIYEALDTTINTRSERFLKEAERSVKEVTADKTTTSQEKKLSNLICKMSRASVSKLQEECLVFRNAFRVLDLNPILKKIKNEEGELIRKKLEDNKDSVDKILTMSQNILNFSKLVSFEDNLKDEEILKLATNISNIRQREPIETRQNTKSDIRFQIVEMLKEVGGFRVTHNFLLYICTKYERLLGDLNV